MLSFDPQLRQLVGPHGTLAVRDDDELTPKLVMLLEGECQGLGPSAAARKAGFSKQRFFQLRQAYLARGATALLNQQRGPKRNYRRTDEVVRQIIRHRFLDPEASADVIAQKLRQGGLAISTRSVARVLAHFGLQKKSSIAANRPRNHRCPSRPDGRTPPSDRSIPTASNAASVNS